MKRALRSTQTLFLITITNLIREVPSARAIGIATFVVASLDPILALPA